MAGDIHEGKFLNKIQTARASAALPAAGAYDATPTEMVCVGAEFVTLYFTYTRGGAGGAFNFQVEVSPDATNWYDTATYEVGVLAAGADNTNRIQREITIYQAIGATAEMFVHGPVPLGGTVETMRITCAESGAVGTPGTVEIIARFA